MNKFLLLLTATLFLSTSSIAQSNLQAIQINQANIILTWDSACTNLSNTNYKLQYKVSGTTGWGNANIVSPNGSATDTFHLTGFSPLTTYEWRVKCFGCAGQPCWVIGPNFTTVCPSNIFQSNTGFSPNPLFGYGNNNQSTDTLVIKNLSNCILNIRPEFIISHQDSSIEQGDITLQWYNTLLGTPFWSMIDYEINGNGEAIGFWNYPDNSDSTGLELGVNDSTAIPIKIHFNNANNNPNQNLAPLGNYSASWSTQEIDSLGNVIQNLETNSIPISLVDCSTFSINVTSLTNSCAGLNNGSAMITSLTNGSGQYSYQWSDGQTTNPATNLSNGTYSCVVTDNNWGCTASVSITLSDRLVAMSSKNSSCGNYGDGIAMISNISNLSYCNSQPYSDDKSNIELVRLIGDGDSIVNNTANLSDQYQDYSNKFTSLNPNQSYSLDIAMGVFNNTGNVWFAGAKAFIDWNIDGDFDDIGEEIGTIANDTTSIPNLNTISFTVPNNLTYGATRLRVVSQLNNNVFGPCEAAAIGSGFTPFYGATEDYTVVINGSNPPTYLWSNGATTQAITGLSAGIYSCTSTDNNGCQIIDSIQITEPTPILVIETITHLDCNGDNNGTVTLAISGGIPPYNTNWYGKDTAALNGGQHNYTITDDSGCILSDSILITDPPSITISSLISNNISCANSSDGSIDISAAGGTGLLSYFWSNGETTEDISNLSFGDYSVIVTDANNCHVIDTTTINPVPFLSIIIDSVFNQTSCSPSNGGIYISVSGGTGTYTYSWSTGDTIQDLTGLSSGTNYVLVNDANGCFVEDTFIITSSIIPISVTLDSNNTNIGQSISCNGYSDGYLFVNASGGSGALSIMWDNGSSTDTIFNLSEGLYGVTVSDNSGCSTYETITIHEPIPISIYRQQTLASCSSTNQNIGIILITSGGNPGYTENWYGNNSDSLTLNTNYTYTVTDTNSCSVTDTFTLILAPPLVITASETDVACYGDSTGAAYFQVLGGVQPYSYLWSNGDTTAIATNLPEGVHTCTVTDNNGCISIDSTIISQPSLPLFTSLNVIDSINCYGDSSGNAYISVTGGVAPYNLLWSNLLRDTISLDSIATNLTSGWVYCTIKDDNNCILKDSVFISENDSLYTINNISNYSAYSVSCNGLSNGSIDISIIGGFEPFNLKWDNLPDSTYIDSLSQGIYFLEVEDYLGCQFSNSVTITEPAQISMIETHENASCYAFNDGSLSFTISGGIPYYSITGAIIDSMITSLDTLRIDSLYAGSQYFELIDQNNCIYTDTIIISEPSSLFGHTILSDYNGVNIRCKGESTGFIILDSISGGNAPYDYYWFDSNGDTLSDFILIDSLSVGNYSLTLNGSLGCPTFIDSFFVTEPNFALTSNIDSIDVTCNSYCNGTLIPTTFDGTPPYNYSWTYPNGFIDLNDTINNLCAGDYHLLVTDTNGCKNIINSIVNEPVPISIQLLTLTNVSVNGNNDGSISVQPNGGNGNYSISWSNGGSNQTINNLITGQYEVVATDLLGCSDTSVYFISEPLALSLNFDSLNSYLSTSCFDSCNGTIYINPVFSPFASFTTYWDGPNGFSSTNEDLFNLCPGSYNLSVISINGDSTHFNFEIIQPEKLQVEIYSDSILCYNGYALSTAYTYGGTLPYSISWNDSISNISTMLSADTHNVKITDLNGCVISDTIILLNPDTMTLSAIIEDINCHNGSDGSFIIFATGGSFPYLYSDNNGISYQSTDDTISNLSAGTYMIKVKDSNNCSQDINVSIINPTLFTATVDPSSDFTVDCNGDCSGANINFSTSISILNQDWGNNNQSFLCAGTYSCVLTDISGCTTTVNNITITEPDPLNLVIGSSQDTTTCFNGGDDGNAQAFASGGTPNTSYNYNWVANGGGIVPAGQQNNDIISNLVPGDYHLTVSDGNNCEITNTITISNNPNRFLIGIDYDSISHILSVDSFSGTFDGLTPVSYLWNTNETTQSIYADTNIQYSVVATDVIGCISDTAFYNVIDIKIIIINSSTTIQSNDIKIFPNPTTGILNISSDDIINELSIINNIGEDVMKNYMTSINNIRNTKLDISHLSRGIYFIRLKINNQILNHKILLQ